LLFLENHFREMFNNNRSFSWIGLNLHKQYEKKTIPKSPL
jgi:hypothetical protein